MRLIDIDDDRNCYIGFDGEYEKWNIDPDVLAEAKTVEPQRWIPCERELPEEYGEYQITWVTSASKRQFIGISEYEVTGEWAAENNRFKGEWLLDDYIKEYPGAKVIAWMPLPEVYRGEDDGEG